MIQIYKHNGEDCKINFFNGRDDVRIDEVVIKKTREVIGNTLHIYTYAEPKEKGIYAFGGNFLFTSNGIYPEFNAPIKLHDRQMNLEK
jgi:hypothetical protein